MVSIVCVSAGLGVTRSLDLTDTQIQCHSNSPAIDARAIGAMAASGPRILPWNQSVTDYQR
jgi:hypothetical protein